MANRISKKGTIILLIASIGFLIASIWLMQVHLKPRNIGSVEFTALKLGNQGQNHLYYIDKAAEYSLSNALDVKSRNYKTQEKVYTNREVCHLQLDACREGKADCETNLKLFCEDEVLKAFKENFAQYIQIFSRETEQKLDVNDYEFQIKTITSEMTTKIRDIEVTGKTTTELKEEEGGVKYSMTPNFKVKVKI
ncbi:MAG: hypothetical protein ABIH63_02525 [archaeon]